MAQFVFEKDNFNALELQLTQEQDKELRATGHTTHSRKFGACSVIFYIGVAVDDNGYAYPVVEDSKVDTGKVIVNLSTYKPAKRK